MQGTTQRLKVRLSAAQRDELDTVCRRRSVTAANVRQARVLLMSDEAHPEGRRRDWEIAAMERFFWSLKHEWTNHQPYNNLEDVRRSVFLYIESFYNPERLHQTLEYLSPDQYEAEHAPAQAV